MTEHDGDLQSSASKHVADEGQFQADIEEGSQLGSEESSSERVVFDSTTVIGETSVETTGVLDWDRRTTDHSSRGKVPTDSSNSHYGAKNREYDNTDQNLQVFAGDVPPSVLSTAKEPALTNPDEWKAGMPMTGHLNSSLGDCPAPSCAASTEDESYSTNTYERKDGMSNTGHLNSSPADVSCDRNFANESEPPPSHPDMEVAIETVNCEHDEPPPLPLGVRCQMFDNGPKSKQNVPIDMGSIDGEDRPVPFGIYFADSGVAEKWSRIDAAKHAVVPDQSGSSIDAPLPVAMQFDSPNQDPASPNQEIVQQPRAEPTVMNLDNWINRISLVARRSHTLTREDSNVVSWSARNDSVNEVVEEDVIIVPEAFLAEANTLQDAPDVEIAQLVEPDHSRFIFKKRYACMVFAFIAVTVIALGLTINSRGKASYLELPQTQSSPSSPSRSSLDAPSSQPSISIRYAIETHVLQRNATFDEMTTTDRRLLALDWITAKDKMNLVASDANLFQRYILALLAFELSNFRWLSDINECNWIGVECDTNGQVVALELIGTGLDGTIPAEIGGLLYLQNLLLSDNVLYGTLPSEIGNLKNISKVTLDDNDFTGTLPSEMYNWKGLTQLSLSQNEFTGTLLSELGNFIKLTNLSLSDNQFMGTLPSEISNLIELAALNVSTNEFSGTFPSEIGKLTKLTELHFSNNQFTGTIPSEVGFLRNMTTLTFYSNKFTGTVPSELGNLHMLSQLKFDNNRFRGTLPAELGNLSKLTQFYVDRNQLTGNLPFTLGNLGEMKLLSLSQNRLTGTLPTEMGNMQGLTHLILNDNQFTGTVPSEFGGLKALEELYLYSNQFSDTIPLELQILTSLRAFLIYFNQFVGTLPSWIGKLTNLTDLRIGGNMFTGTLPSELGLLTNLKNLQVESNKFTGTLPTWIGNLRNLSYLWIYDNDFTGTFPSEIENNLDLMSLCLRNNEFTGRIPADIMMRDCPW
ncbi:hypothetical protein HJC23_010693 [Cyclotella cryptica]|uniref:Disease resistance R13L4/SHOC-2-like LRR domain-containing protein n=1 Tax=Cyclotella cryptica TaxID=29204 RepID=A0ABD3P8I2_9STRA